MATNKEIIRTIRKAGKMKMLAPVQSKHDVIYVNVEKSSVIEMYSKPRNGKDEYQTGMEVHVTDGDLYFDVDHNSPDAD